MENNKRHTRIKQKNFSFILDDSIKEKLSSLRKEICSAHNNSNNYNFAYRNHNVKISESTFDESIFKVDSLDLMYKDYTIYTPEEVVYNLQITNVKKFKDKEIEFKIYINNSKFKKIKVNTYHNVNNFYSINGNINWRHYSSTLDELFQSIDYSELITFFQNFFNENKSVYSFKVNNKHQKSIDLKKSSYPIKLGKMLSSFKIDDKEFLLKILRYITKDGNDKGWQNAYNLERLAKYLNSLDKSVLNEEIIQAAVDIAVISEILE